MKRRRTTDPSRSGTAAVEAAIMLPLLIIATFTAIDVAQYITTAQVVSSASREGARVATRNGTGNVDEINAAVLGYLSDAMQGLSESELRSAVSIRVIDVSQSDSNGRGILTGQSIAKVQSGAMLEIRIAFDFNDVRWLGGPSYGTPTTSTFCRRE